MAQKQVGKIKKGRVEFYFDKFKKYAQFLLNRHDVLYPLMEQYFERVRNSQIPMMRFLEHLSVEQHREITDQNIKNFLRHSLNDTAYEDAIVLIDQWKSDKLLGVPREEIEITDILTVLNIRKEIYIDFLEKYTQSLSLFRSVVAELDRFQALVQQYAFNSYVEIHQERLSNENRFISSLINNSVDGILSFDEQLKITEFNQVLEKWHGIKKEEVIGKDILSVFSIYRESEKNSPVSRALKGERTFIAERPFLDREGYYEANIVPLYGGKGQITGGIIITHDITKRKKTEEEIKETKHLLQEITDAVPNVIYLSDFITKEVLFVNKAVASLAGYSPEEVKTFNREKLAQLIHPVDLPAMEKQAEEIKKLKEGEISELDVRIRHKDGRWRWISTKSKVFRYGDGGEPLQVIRVFEDVTEVVEAQQTIQQQNDELAATLEELQAAEEQLREINEELEQRVEVRTRELSESEINVKQREEQLRLITDALPVFISYIKNDYTYGFVNNAYEKLFQVKREDIIGKPIKDIIGEKAFMNSLNPIKSALNGEVVESELLQDYGKAGKKWMRVSFVPHFISNEVVGTFALVEDISRMKEIQMEQENLLMRLNEVNQEKEQAFKDLEKKNKALERTNTDLDNFIYSASHDLKSPITNLEGLMSILKNSMEGKLDAKEEKVLEMMWTSVQRLQTTIGDLVEITRYQKDLEDAVEEPVSFAELSNEIKEDIYHLISESKANITENFEVGKIVYKRSNLRSILYNLLSNAVKYRSPGRELHIALRTYIQEGCIVLSVKDNGLGLSLNQQKKLFTLFRRMHQHVEGTGVGLYTIKRIVENNKGRIEVKSEEGRGTEFLVFLAPAQEA